MQNKVDARILADLKKLFRTSYENDLSVYKELEKEIKEDPSIVNDEIRTEIEMYKIKAQTGIFVYKLIEKCKTIKQLRKQKKIIENSAFDYGTKYTTALENIKNDLHADKSFDMVCDKIKFHLLKDAVKKITESIVMSENSYYKLPDEVVIELNMINTDIYELKLKIVKTPLEKVDVRNNLYEELDDLLEKRKKIINKFIGIEETDLILAEIENIENETTRSYDKLKKPSYFLTKDTFKSKLNSLNETLEDLKTNRLKSKTFYMLHINDGKHNSIALSKDIISFSQEREDIIKSVLGEDTPLLLTLKEISNLEGSSKRTAKKKTSLLGDLINNLTNDSALKECHKAIISALESVFEINEKIEIKSYEITFEEKKQELEQAYKDLPKEIEKSILIEMGRKVAEKAEIKKLMKLELTTVFDDSGAVLNNPLNEI